MLTTTASIPYLFSSLYIDISAIFYNIHDKEFLQKYITLFNYPNICVCYFCIVSNLLQFVWM